MNITLQKSIESTPTVKEVKKLTDGSVLLPYTTASVEFEFKLSKQKDGKYMIESITDKKYKQSLKNAENTYLLDTSSQQNFLTSLGKALDNYIPSWRMNVREKGIQAYALLGFEKEIAQNNALEETKKAQQEIKDSIPPEVVELSKEAWGRRNTEKKEYKYFYVFDNAQGKRDVWVSLQDKGSTIVVSLEAANSFGIKKGKKTFEVSKLQKEDIPKEIVSHLKEGIEMKAFTGKETLKVTNEALLGKAWAKARKALIVFDHYAK